MPAWPPARNHRRTAWQSPAASGPERFEHWAANGNFLYTPNHPVITVFFDIVHLGMLKAGFSQDIPVGRLAEVRAALPDYLRDGVLWPVYPEIAERLGIEAVPAEWRESAAREAGRSFSLDEMIARTWTNLTALSEDQLAQARRGFPGGADYLALCAGD